MFSFEDKRDEAKRALTALKQRASNREMNRRKGWQAFARRIEVAAEIVADYERAIERAQRLASERGPSLAAQYLLDLLSRPAGSLWPAGADKDGEDGSD